MEQGGHKGSPIVWTAEVGRVSVVAGRASVEPGEDEDVEQGDRKGQYISKRETRVGYRTGDHKGPPRRIPAALAPTIRRSGPPRPCIVRVHHISSPYFKCIDHKGYTCPRDRVPLLWTRWLFARNIIGMMACPRPVAYHSLIAPFSAIKLVDASIGGDVFSSFAGSADGGF